MTISEQTLNSGGFGPSSYILMLAWFYFALCANATGQMMYPLAWMLWLVPDFFPNTMVRIWPSTTLRTSQCHRDSTKKMSR